MTQNTLTILNNHFTSFLKDNGDDEIVGRWIDKDNQKSFIKIMGDFLSKKSKKDSRKSDGPKKGKTAYIYYCMSQRQILTAEFPELTNKQITSKLGEMWNEIKDDAEQVKEYRELSEQDKVRYNTEISEFKNSDDEDGKKKKRKTKKISNGLKKNNSAYLYFCEDERKKIKNEGINLNSKEIISELGKRWSIVKDKNGEQFRKYEKMAKTDHERYEREKAELVGSNEQVIVDEKPVPIVEIKKVNDKKKIVNPPLIEKKKNSSSAPKKSAVEKKKIIRKAKIEDEELLEEDD